MAYNILFFYITVALYFISGFLFIAFLIKRKNDLFSYYRQWFLIAAVSGAFFFVTRYREAGYLPLVTLFEITFFYGWMISIFYVIFVKREMARFVQVAILSLCYIFFVWDIFIDKTIYPLNPLLNSFWLGIHVPMAILGYSAFAVSFAISIYYVYAERRGKSLSRLASLNSGLITGGVTFLGICIITGAIWARSAWGKFWSWDPKETWALITLLIYGSAIATRKFFKLSSRWQAVISIFGFVAMLLTFFGVNLFFKSHHSYS